MLIEPIDEKFAFLLKMSLSSISHSHSSSELSLDSQSVENASILQSYNSQSAKSLTRSFSLLSRHTKSEFSLFENSSTVSSTSSTRTNLSLNIDQYGFVIDRSSQESTMQRHSNVQESLNAVTKWEALLVKLTALHLKDWLTKTTLKKRIFKGVPDTQRKRVWALLLRRPTFALQKETPIYRIDDHFNGISGFERQIDVDIVRTLRDHVLYKDRYSCGQQKLFKVLVAFANLFPSIGYCQGMSSLAGVLLIYFDEEQAFNMMIRLFERRSLANLYSHGFPLLFELFHIQHALMQKFVPRVWNHFAKHSISSSLYATKWYLSMFLCFPFPLSMRLWDLYMLYGIDVFPVFCVAFLRYIENAILVLDFDPLLSYLCRPDEVSPMNVEKVMEIVMDLWERVEKSKSRNLKVLHDEYARLTKASHK